MDSHDLPGAVERLLAAGNDEDGALTGALELIAEGFAAKTATVHAIDVSSDAERPDLVIVADRGLPEAVRAHVRHIPFGKGMAGICAERREPVTVCNLQTDDSGVVRPGARQTGVAGAIVVPVLDAGGARLVGTLGIGKPGEHTYSDDERKVLARCAAALAPLLLARSGVKAG
ncbi:MAG: GAF domain-containing protein [Rhodospirillales bacterium]|nr:GAF domain-containing protein [Rhodospirillales bacterium]